MDSEFTVLVVDDNYADFIAVRRAIKKMKKAFNIFHCYDTEEAIEYLYEVIALENGILPNLMFLDLNMPGINGQKFLRIIRSQPEWCHIPVVILSTSSDKRDIDTCIKQGANGYLVKPVNYMHLNQVVTETVSYWYTQYLYCSRTPTFEE